MCVRILDELFHRFKNGGNVNHAFGIELSGYRRSASCMLHGLMHKESDTLYVRQVVGLL